MKVEDVVFVFALVFCIVSVLPLFNDPYYHRDRVDFWIWLKREVFEELHGEKE